METPHPSIVFRVFASVWCCRVAFRRNLFEKIAESFRRRPRDNIFPLGSSGRKNFHPRCGCVGGRSRDRGMERGRSPAADVSDAPAGGEEPARIPKQIFIEDRCRSIHHY